MAKSRDAFRTISEVSEALDTPAHVLRFWESKFKQIKPVKRAGGRRYYRPDDLALLAAIKDMLHEQGHSIKHVQKLIRDDGVKQIVSVGHALLGSTADGTITQPDPTPAPVMPPPVPPRGVDDAQTDLFAGAETPLVAPAPAKPPHIEITSVRAVPDPVDAAEDDSEGDDANIFATKSAVAGIVQDSMTPPAPQSGHVAAPDLPPPPKVRDDIPARVLALLAKADPTRTRANAAQIAPLVARLTALRDEMQHPW